MKRAQSRSLRWDLIARLVALHTAIAAVLVLAILSSLWAGGFLVDEPDSRTIDTLRAAVERDAQGRLVLRETRAVKQLFLDDASFWFVIRDRQGGRLAHGRVPSELMRIGDMLKSFDWARLGWNVGKDRAALRLDWVDSDIGELQVLASSAGGPLPLHKLLSTLAGAFLVIILPYVAFTTLITFVAVSLVVRKSLTSLGEVATQAEKIDFDRRGTRLPAEKIPAEVIPLVGAVNDALQRLDEGYERHQRFLIDAAHELRTPIAILQTRAESLASSPEQSRLLQDIARLATLAEQLLDLQRLAGQPHGQARADLVAIGRRVCADLAPLAIAAGYSMNFDSEPDRVDVHCDPAALERAVTNLVQNAIEHGGRRGAITVRVEDRGTIEIMDEGPGVPAEHRERIFEPFYRAHPRDRGAGLGLHLVQELVHRHEGQVTVEERPSGGACFRITLPLCATTPRHAMLP